MSNSELFLNISRLYKIINNKKKRTFFLLLILMIVSSLMEAISISAVLPYIGVLSNPNKIFYHKYSQFLIRAFSIKSAQELLWPISVLFCLIIFLGISLRLILLWTQTKLSYGTSSEFATSIYLRTLFQPYTVHISRNSSEIITGITNKSESILLYLILPLLNIISSLVTIIIILGFLFFINPLMSILLLISFGSIYAAFMFFVKKRLAYNSSVLSREYTLMIKSLQEGLGGIRDVIIDGTQNVYGESFNKAQTNYSKSLSNNVILSTGPRLILEFLGIIFICIIAYYLALNETSFSSTLPVLAALVMGIQRLLPALQTFYYNWASFNGGKKSVDDGLNFLEQEFPKHAFEFNTTKISFDKSINFNRIGFKYKDANKFVFRDLSLSLEKGKRYGIIGRTGCGKTTFLDLLMGLLLPSEGNLSIDNKIITDENNRSWQRIIAHVPQSIYLSDTTIIANIAFGQEPDKVDMNRIKLVSKRAQINETIESLPNGYNTIVGERGVKLSGGQRQRIGIARALYKEASVIILDEATSALDNETEMAVMDGIEKLGDDITIIIVAHRITTLRNCDKIFEFSNGNITKEGSFNEFVTLLN
jgi:ABC-type multidrug transport system fused ATPase/permease subunit